MIPYLTTPLGTVPTFPILVVFGLLSMMGLTFFSLKNEPNPAEEESYIFPKLVMAGMGGFLGSAVLDSLLNRNLTGSLQITGITFYGGLLGACTTLWLLLKVTQHRTAYSIGEWFNRLTLPFLAFHFWGRIGCFFGGCCYGKVTHSCIGVAFPDQPELNIIHNGVRRYPTQLFEAAALLLLFVLLRKNRRPFENYILMYAVFRFFNEFLRGDVRGYLLPWFSPSQVISMVLFAAVVGYKFVSRCRKAV